PPSAASLREAGHADVAFDGLDRRLLRATNVLLESHLAPPAHTPAPGRGAGDQVTESLFLRDLTMALPDGPRQEDFSSLRRPGARQVLHRLQADAVAFAFVEGLGPSF